jgi:predicted HicB family RNase H-like nuclease
MTTVHLPPDLHRALKLRAVKEGIPLQDLIEQLLRRAVKSKRA